MSTSDKENMPKTIKYRLKISTKERLNKNLET